LQTTDGRVIAYSEREREFTFAKNHKKIKIYNKPRATEHNHVSETQRYYNVK